jgi:demethylmenaquinone methyltransferase/2-methoxy-6-polyprenyl-1,4-benzoquinol methylase
MTGGLDAERRRARSRRFYDAQAVWYEATRRPFLAGRRATIRALRLRPGETVLEVGCGTGWNLPHLLGAVGPAGHVLGLEWSSGMLARARARGLPANVVLQQGDAARDDPPGDLPIDAALFSYSLSAIPEPERALERVCRRLRAGGRIGIVDFRPRRRGWLAVFDPILLAHGRRSSCDFGVDPVPWLREHGFRVDVRGQVGGFGYRLVASGAER